MKKGNSLAQFTPEQVLAFHQGNFGSGGKIEVMSKVALHNVLDLTLAYTPGVAKACMHIYEHPEAVSELTAKDNTVAVVTDGTAILGLGNIGTRAGLPVMEGKAVLFKMLAGLDAFPLCIDTQDPQKIIETVMLTQANFGGINLEDIAAPRCFEIESTLADQLDIPVFHDDQHGTAVVVLAALYNAVRYTGKRISDCSIVINGAGAAGIAIARLLMLENPGDLILCDTFGILHPSVQQMNPAQAQIAQETNRNGVKGSLADAVRGADVFIGVSAKNVLLPQMVQSMNTDPIIFAMANPDPEILPHLAYEAGAAIVATGRSDFANQINNVMGFPGIFRGAMDVKATAINNDMKLVAAQAIASLTTENELNEGSIIVNPLHPEVIAKEAEAVGQKAIELGLARRMQKLGEIYQRVLQLRKFNEERLRFAQEQFNSDMQ